MENAIEYTVLNYLLNNLQVPVYMEEPEKEIPVQYVLIEKTGSSKQNFIRSATFALQSYGGTLEQAIDLNETVKAVMDAFWQHQAVYSCKLDSDYNYTDTETKRYRYQAVYHITY